MLNMDLPSPAVDIDQTLVSAAHDSSFLDRKDRVGSSLRAGVVVDGRFWVNAATSGTCKDEEI